MIAFAVVVAVLLGLGMSLWWYLEGGDDLPMD